MKEILNHLNERVKNPFLGSFSVSWIFFNWEAIVTVFISKDELVYGKRVLEIWYYLNFWDSFGFPFLSACLYVTWFSAFLTGISYVTETMAAWKAHNKLMITKRYSVSGEKYVRIYEELFDERKRLTGLRDELDKTKNEKSELSEKLLSEENTSKELSSELGKLTEGMNRLEKENNSYKSQFESITLNFGTASEAVKLKERSNLQEKIFKSLLKDRTVQVNSDKNTNYLIESGSGPSFEVTNEIASWNTLKSQHPELSDASWICHTHPDKLTFNEVSSGAEYRFMRKFKLSFDPDTVEFATIHLIVDDFLQMELNGHFICDEKMAYFDQIHHFDLKKRLNYQGDNILDFRVRNRSHKFTQPHSSPGLINPYGIIYSLHIKFLPFSF